MVMSSREGDAKGSGDGATPKSGPTKAVSIAEPENTSPIISPLDNQPHKQFSAGVGKRLTGRPPSIHSSSKISLRSQTSFEDLPAAALSKLAESMAPNQRQTHKKTHQHERLRSQVSDWLQAQKAKKLARKARKQARHAHTGDGHQHGSSESARRLSTESGSSTISLEDLQRILDANLLVSSPHHTPTASPKLGPRRPSYSSRKRPSSRRMSKNASSDTEFFDGDVVVPSCDVVLDNSKTLSYAGGAASSQVNLAAAGHRAEKEAHGWLVFKSEILRLAHTLRLKGWRRVPLENGADIEVERLSGALTNAVYVVSPPKDMSTLRSSDDTKPKKPPAKLLLRIYGPQVDHLIDRESELSILRRLARKKIGPRLLGTFRNGRFEEYFASKTLTWSDLRVPETSKQIAKRMRELHDGIDLLEKERDEGPFVWRNWDKWVERCEQVISFLDGQLSQHDSNTIPSKSDAWKSRGFVCGVEWPVFREMVETYRAWLNDKYGGESGIREKLVFAHNDTQYGNILRLLPTTESPLLLPANSHKQLVVIDFEYASANTSGLEFANHFTEWCYNYHDTKAHACNTKAYPTPDEQRRFIRAYLNHRPQFTSSASATPKAVASTGSTTSISSFMLDSRTPSGVNTYQEEEDKREQQLAKQVEQLMIETRLWRVANSAQWVAWGIVQANIPELDAADASSATESTSPTELPDSSSAVSSAGQQAGQNQEDHVGSDMPEPLEESSEEEAEFDYLAYAQERAMFFWGDCVNLGLVKLEDLPEAVQKNIKLVGY